MATISNLQRPSSESSSSPPSWDVFLSFFGRDTRCNFISHLYYALDQAGIHTFMDEPELEKGEEISRGLFSAIHASKTFVVVLSENYAYSKWCLSELIEILSCRRTKGQVVIPVFYYVDPSNVRRHEGIFGEALESQKNLQSDDMIEKWKSALAEIGKLTGYHLKKNENEYEMDTIQKIVENVARQTSREVLHLPTYLSGLDSAIEDIHQKISMDLNDVSAIGICGMGGIGKTTTAKTFYNRYADRFHISCFIENIKQNSQGSNHLPVILRQLLIGLLRKKDYKFTDVESGIKKLMQIVYSKKALIVFDDLDKSSYSESLVRLCNLFYTGSTIIITTRDANLLNRLNIEIYMVKKLDQISSLELFSYHAFGKPTPLESFRELSERFVTYAGGLPLALKVLGSSLHGRSSMLFWKAKLEKVRIIPDNDIQKILQLSYNELEDETEKTIFLDIAFFFVGKDRDEAVHIFKSCNFFPDVGIPVLVERCLLWVDENDKFCMHNLVEEMGRKLGRNRYLWWRGNASENLLNLEGINKIEGLVLDLTAWTKGHFNVKIFQKMPYLRLLRIVGAHNIKGNFKSSLPELRCIRWAYCPWTCLPNKFSPQKLVSFNMPSSKLKTLWNSTVPPESLKYINVSYSENLRTIDDFRDLKLVEKLLLNGCTSLLKVHPSVGQLSKLSHLDISRCFNLKHLPEQLGDMKCLKMLDASDTAIEQLPDSICTLKKLVNLRLGGCKRLKKLPKLFGNMEGLREFDASESLIEKLPDSFEGLSSLVELRLFRCKNLTNLPNSIWRLKLLKVLNLDQCRKLERLPEQLGKMHCLEELKASFTAIEEVPDSIGQLRRLQVLKIDCCMNILYLPNSMCNLTSLADFRIRINVPEMVPNMKLLLSLSFSTLKRLTIRDMGQSFSSAKPISLSKLYNLQYLVLDEWSTSFPELPLNLRGLKVFNHAALVQLPDLQSLKCLISLDIKECTSLQSLPSLPPDLQTLLASACTNLQDIPDLSMFKKLRKLYMYECSNLKSIKLKQSCLQVRFEAILQNGDIPEWFSYRSSGRTVSFVFPPVLPPNCLDVAFCVVYAIKTSTARILSHIKAVITNKTRGITNYQLILARTNTVSEVYSSIKCLSIRAISVKSGDIVKVSFQKLLFGRHFGQEVTVGEVKVLMCGVHLIQKHRPLQEEETQ